MKTSREDFENPGMMSVEDLGNYKAIERKPVCATYRAHKVCSMGQPSSGGLSLLISLKILEHFNLAAQGKDSVQAWHVMGEASRLAFADRNYYMADPSYVQSPDEMLLNPNYIAERAKLISQDTAAQKIMYGVPKAWEQKKKIAPEPIYPKPPGTTHISIVDGAGNIVSMTNSVEDSFGSRMMVDGFILNNQLTDFSFMPEVEGQLIANRVEGGKRPRSTMTPVIVFAPNGAPKMVIGSAGGSAIMGYVLQRIVSVIDWNMDIESAVAAPNIINRGKGFEMELGASDIAEPLRKKGHPVDVVDLNSGIAAIVFDGQGGMTGYADPRREGTAEGR
jgi:gamma-glutamyltranspeptidase/glutathione hydrolase